MPWGALIGARLPTLGREEVDESAVTHVAHGVPESWMAGENVDSPGKGRQPTGTESTLYRHRSDKASPQPTVAAIRLPEGQRRQETFAR